MQKLAPLTVLSCSFFYFLSNAGSHIIHNNTYYLQDIDIVVVPTYFVPQITCGKQADMHSTVRQGIHLFLVQQ